MAKRKTIGVNPLDTLVPDPKPGQWNKSPAAAQARSAGPSVPAPAAQVAPPPSPADLVNRVQSLEKENEFIKWLVGGAILLALLL